MDKSTDCDISLLNQNSFTQTLTNCLRIIDTVDIVDIYQIHCPTQEIQNCAECVTELEQILHTNQLLNTITKFEIQGNKTEVAPTPQRLGEELAVDIILSNEAGEDIPLNTEEDEDLKCRSSRVRRGSSLKSEKTPASTSASKKIVRFADVLGLDLADVRTYIDEVPKIPQSAFDDLICPPARCDRTLFALFEQPHLNRDGFAQKIIRHMIALEYIVLQVSALCVRGCVRVRNLDYNKSVVVRYTLDSWEHCEDVQCSYVEGSSDGFTDRFSFILYASTITIGQQLEFAVRFQCCGEEFWDNNNDDNFCFRCMPASVAAQTKEEAPSVRYIRPLSSMEVQEYIARSLNQNKISRFNTTTTNTKQEVAIICAVVVLAIILWFLRTVIL